MRWTYRSLLPLTMAAVVVSFATYHMMGGNVIRSETVLKQVANDPEFLKYFGQNLKSLSTLDSDSDGVPDIKDDDIDNDGVPNDNDSDVDNDGTENASDPSSALAYLIRAVGMLESEASNKSAIASANSVAGVQGLKGEKGDTGNAGPQGRTGNNGLVGVVTDDGVVKTTLSGTDLDVQILLTVGSGLEKTLAGLSLTTTCATNELLKWTGSAWSCSSDSGGISYASGDGVSISSGVITSILGTTIETSELASSAVTTTKLADGSIIASKIVDGQVLTAKVADGAIAASKIGTDAVITSKIIDSAVTFAKIQALAPSSLFGNATGSATSGTNISLGDGLAFDTGALANTGILTVSVGGPLQSTGGQSPTISIVKATGLVDGYLSAADFATFAAKQGALPTGLSTQYLKGDQTLGTLDTTAVAENGNLYFTNSRADGRITLQKAAVNGLATLDGSGKIPTSQLPALAVTDTYVVADEAAMLALSANQGDVAVRNDVNKSFILVSAPASTLANWQELLTPGAPVLAVNGQTGSVTLTSSGISEGVNLYFTEARARGALSTSGPLTYNSSTGVVGLTQASGSSAGYLSAVDFTAFNNKQNALSVGAAAQYLRGDQTLGTLNTTAVPEGANLYYTQGRFDSSLGSKTTDDITEGAANLFFTQGRFDSALVAKTTSNITEGANLYFTSARFNSAFGAKNTDDLPEGLTNKYFSDARADGRIAVQKNVAGGLATLDGGGKVPTSQLPATVINDTYVVSSQAAMLALSANKGDVAVRTDTSESYILSSTPATTLANWVKLLNPTAPVLSVNGQTGAITLASSNIAEGTNLYYTDARARGALSVSGPLAYNSGTGVIGIDQATTSGGGFLAATDWNTFNAKENALTFTGRGIFTRSGNAVSAITCLNGQVLVFSGSAWVCGADANNTYSAGTGLGLSGSTFNLADTTVTAGAYGSASSIPVLTVDTQGRLTGVTNTTIGGLTSVNLATNAGITNTQLANSGLTFALGSAGTDVNLSSTTVNLGGTTTINIPNASAAARGLVNTSAQTLAGAKTFGNALATAKGADFSTGGSSNDVNFGDTSLVRLTGASAQTITGIAGGTDGRILTIINAGSAAASITNNDTNSAAANRITTGTGSALSLAVDASINLVYDVGATKWRVIGGTGGSGAGYVSVDITDKATSGAIGTAAATVDVATNFNINQTTASQTLTIPSPTNTTTTKGKVITVNNVGTANFTIGGVTVPAGSYGSAFVWTGTVWNPINAASNVASQAVTSNITSGQTTTSTSYVDVTNGTVTISSPGTYNVSYSVPFVASAAGTAVSFQLTDSTNATVANTATTAYAPVSGIRSGTAVVGDVGTSVACSSTGAVSSCSNALVASGNRYTLNYADLGYTPIVLLQYRDTLNTSTSANDMSIVPVVGTPTNTSAQFFLEETSSITQNGTVYVQLINPSDASLGHATLPSVPVVFPSAGTYKLRYKTANANNTVTIYNNATEGAGYVSTNLIGGNAPVIGQSVDYVQVTGTATNWTLSANGTAINPTTVTTLGNIPYSSGVFTLMAGKTYYLEGAMGLTTSAGSVIYQWRDIGGNALIGTAAQLSGTAIQTTHAQALATFTPTQNTTVRLEVISGGGQTNVDAPPRATYMKITQLGSTAFTGVAMSTLQSAIANNSLDNTNFTQTWDFSTLSTGSGLVSNANALTSGILQQLATSSTAFTGALLNLSSTGNNAGVTGSLAKLDIVGSSSAAKGLTINNAGTGDGLNIASTGTGLAINASGAVAFKRGSDYSTVGSTNNVDFGNASLVRLTGASAQTITGIAGGSDGELLTIINAASQAASISNESTSSTAANRIKTGTGADLSLAADASLSLVYDSGASRWRVVGGTGGSGASYASVDIANLASGGAIGTAAATVDVATNFNVNQTTASQTLTIPNPTNTTTTRGKIVTVNNTGATNFTIGGITVPAGSYGSAFVWNGTVWNPINAASNVAAAYARIARTATTTAATNPTTNFDFDTVSYASGMTANTTTDTVTVTTTGRYKIAYYYTPQSVAQNNSVALFVNGAKNGNSVVMDMSNADSSRYVTFERNLSAGDTIAIRFDIADTVSFIASPSGDVAYMTVEQVSGNTPVIGQSVDFAQFRLAANTTAYSANADIPQGTTVTTNAGNIPVTSAGLINLTAGKTYRFDAQVALSNAGSNAYLYYGLYDTSNVRIPNSPTGVAASTELTLSGISSAPSFGFVYTPTTNQTVKFRTDGVGGSPLINSGNTYFTVTQLGSSAVTTYDGVARTNAITLGADYATTAGNIWQDTNLSISVPGSGTWEVGYDVTGQAVNNGGSSSMKVRLYDVTAGAAVANSERYVTSEGDTGYSPVGKGSASLTQFLTTTSSNIYRVQVFEEPGGNTNQHPTLFAASSLRYNQISGMLPATGQSVDFVHLKPTDQTGFGSGVDVDLSSVTSGNMTTDLSANTITLRAGKTYRLIANLRIYAGTTDIEYGWVNSSNTELVANTGRGHVNNDGGSQNGDSFAELIYTPSSDITVKVRGLAGLANGNFESRASTISVVQLGSTNVSTGVALSTITTALANNTLDNTNFTQTWNWSSLAAGTSGLTFANTVGGTTQNNVITIMGGNNAGVAASQLITLKRPDGTVIGSVSQNAASTVAFNTTSDERLKTNIVDTAQGLDSLLKIKVRDFAYKSDASGKIVQGFIAQELEETYPGAVTVGSDAVDAGGLLANPWQVDYAKLTPLLVKSVQELSVKVDAQSVAMNGAKLEGITALTQRVDTLTAGLTVVQGKVTDFTDALARVDLRIADLDARIKAMEGVKTATAAAPQVTNTTVNNTTVVEDKNQLGDTKISKGKIGVKVTFAKKFDTKPVIYITSTTGSFQYLLSDVTTEGFTVKLDNPAQFDVVFSWLAAERKDDKSVTTELDPTQPHQLNTQDIIPLTEKITTETPVHP